MRRESPRASAEVTLVRDNGARKRDYEEMKAGAQAIYRADSRRQADLSFRGFRRWKSEYGPMVRQLELYCPSACCRSSLSPSIGGASCAPPISSSVASWTCDAVRGLVCFVNVKSVDRIIYCIFQRFNLGWKNRTVRVFTQAA